MNFFFDIFNCISGLLFIAIIVYCFYYIYYYSQKGKLSTRDFLTKKFLTLSGCLTTLNSWWAHPKPPILGKWSVETNFRTRLGVVNPRSMEHQKMLRKVWGYHDKTQPSKIAKRTFSTAADIAVKMLKDWFWLTSMAISNVEIMILIILYYVHLFLQKRIFSITQGSWKKKFVCHISGDFEKRTLWFWKKSFEQRHSPIRHFPKF